MSRDEITADNNKSDHRKKKIYNSINRKIGQAIDKCNLIGEGDRILIAVSGGKDSLILLRYLKEFQRKAPVSFEILAAHVDQGGPFNEGASRVRGLLEELEIPFVIERQEIHEAIERLSKPGDTPCAVCGRLRRGVLYRLATENNCNKLALGHHGDDLMETFLLNAFFAGKLGSMSPHYLSRKNNIHVIRPLYLCREDEIREYANLLNLETVTCSFCEADSGFKRKEIKDLLLELDYKYAGLKDSLLKSLSNVHIQELPDTRFWKDNFSTPNE